MYFLLALLCRVWRHIDYLCCLVTPIRYTCCLFPFLLSIHNWKLTFMFENQHFAFVPLFLDVSVYFYFNFLWNCNSRKIQYHKNKIIREWGKYNKKSNGKHLYHLFFFQYDKKKKQHRCFSLIFSPLFFHFYFLAVRGDVLMSRDYEGWLFVFENGSRRSLALYTFAEKDSLPLRADIFIIYVSFFLFADDSYYRSFCQVGFNYCSPFFQFSLYVSVSRSYR